MKIRRKFLQLTRSTYPYGTEHRLESYLPTNYKKDGFGNYYISVGDNYSTMFTCHLDTSCGKSSKVTHDFYDNYIMTDGTTILGADDKAGMIVILYMIEKNIPGLYYFFTGEEVGCIGSSDLADGFEKGIGYPDELKNIKKVVSFDRKGTNSVITDQFYGRCCSDEFAKDLCSKLNSTGFGLAMVPDNTGILTDSAQFMSLISECTNISVGYYDEHTFREKQDIDHLYKLCKSVVSIDWESLPIVRDPKADYNWKYWKDNYEEFDLYDPVGKMAGQSYKEDSKSYYRSSLYSEYSENLYTYVLDKETNSKRKAYISQTWINHEKLLIIDMLKKQNRKVSDIEWNGVTCWTEDEAEIGKTYLGSRGDLMMFIPSFKEIPIAHLKYDIKEKEKEENDDWENPNLDSNMWNGFTGFII